MELSLIKERADGRVVLSMRHSGGGTAPGPPTTPSRTQLPNGALALLTAGGGSWGRFRGNGGLLVEVEN